MNFRLRFGIIDTQSALFLAEFESIHSSVFFQYLIPGAPFWHSGQRLSNISDPCAAVVSNFVLRI